MKEDNGDYVSMPVGARMKHQNDNMQSMSTLGTSTTAPTLSFAVDDDKDETLWQFFRDVLRYAKNRSWKKKLLTAFIILCSAYVVIDLIFLGNVQNTINICLEWLSLNPFGAVFSFILLFIVATLLFVPPMILMFGAGYVFTQMTNFGYGVLCATVVCFIGSCIGAVLAFLRSRYMMRDMVLLFSQRFPIIKAADQAFKRNGFRVMFLLRLCPVVPYNGLNYIGGVLDISIEDFTKAMVGLIPTILLWVFSGASAKNLTDQSVDGEGARLYMIILLSSGLAFGLIALVLIWKFAMKELRKEIELDSAENWFRYRKKNSKESLSEIPDEVAISSQEGQEVTLVEPEHALYSPAMFHWLGIRANGLEGRAEGRDDGKDEEWFWLWT